MSYSSTDGKSEKSVEAGKTVIKTEVKNSLQINNKKFSIKEGVVSWYSMKKTKL